MTLDDGWYAESSFAGPKAVLAYLSRYTHRIAISNRRLIRADAGGVTFTVKNYRVEGPGRYTTMTLAPHEFIRRFLMHVLPKGFHRIRHYGLLGQQQPRCGAILPNPPRFRAWARFSDAGSALHPARPSSRRPTNLHLMGLSG